MAHLKTLDPNQAEGKLKELFDAVNYKMGLVPNVMRTMGNSSIVLEAYLASDQALSKSSIGRELNELIAITIATINECDYCNAAHTFLALKLGIDIQSIELAREAVSTDRKISAALQFVKEAVLFRGHTSTLGVEKLKTAGFDDAAIVEIIAAISLNVFTNYLNTIADTALDFPNFSSINQHQTNI